jgi:isoquinoline 1-oxidoreductase alpha subunit
VSTHSFILNGKSVSVDCQDDLRMLWVVRDLLGVHGPKYGCGLGVCQACTSHLNGRAVNLCSIPVSDVKSTDQITTIEGLPATVGADLHPMQQAWIDYDVSQCGYCQPGQIMAAVAHVEQWRADGTPIDDAALDEIRNVCRCGTYPRIRQAVVAGAANMPATPAKVVQRLVLHVVGYRQAMHGLLIELNTNEGVVHGLHVQLHQKGHVVGTATVAKLTTKRKRVVVRAKHPHKIHSGKATLIVVRAGHSMLRHNIHIR